MNLNNKIMLLPLLVPLTAAAGCTSLNYTSPGGEHFSRRSFGSKTTISALTVETATNGLRRVELRGYMNDSVQALGTITEAAVRAGIQSAKP